MHTKWNVPMPLQHSHCCAPHRQRQQDIIQRTCSIYSLLQNLGKMFQINQKQFYEESIKICIKMPHITGKPFFPTPLILVQQTLSFQMILDMFRSDAYQGRYTSMNIHQIEREWENTKTRCFKGHIFQNFLGVTPPNPHN